jgi:DNA-binding MarR family transcriptional regulator
MSFFSTIRKWWLAAWKWLLADPEAHVPDITTEQAAEIKALYDLGGFTQKQLGKMWGVHQSQISRILSGDRH